MMGKKVSPPDRQAVSTPTLRRTAAASSAASQDASDAPLRMANSR
jgi:hypothetical protein